ncbi:MAG TPA: alpha/beta fold hydrolase [Thermoplasmata archaeon]|nr:alpha/beta fold hydrolase [Thermoplasmata archaeon]
MEPSAASPVAEELRRWLALPLVAQPSVTSDSERVLFLSDETGVPRPWVVGFRGGPTAPLWPGTERVAGVVASPAGPRAIVAADAGGNEHWQLYRLEGTDPATEAGAVVPLTHDPSVIHRPGRWRPNGRHFLFASNARDRRYFDIQELDATMGGAPRPLFAEDATLSVADASENRALVVRANTNLDVDLILLDGERRLHLNPHAGEMTVLDAAIGPDAVYAAANPDREFTALVRFRPGGGRPEFLRDYPDGDVEIVRPCPVGSSVAISINRKGWSEVRLVDPVGGEDRVFNSGPRGVVSSIDWAPDGSAFAFAVGSIDGTQIFRRDIATGKERRLAGPSAVPVPLPPPVARELLARDRVRIPYLELEPKGTARGTIVWVHGGPEAQARPGFAPVVECLVGRGWRLVLPNVRGSTGYGRTFVHLDDRRRRMESVGDLADLVAELVRRGKATPGRIGLVGGSYGGFMVLAGASAFPELWGALVDVVGIANFVTFLEKTGPWRRALREAEYGSLAEDREFLESISPVRTADRIRAPLLVLHGRNDPRVPLAEAEQITRAVKAHGRPVELLVFDDEGHGLVRRENRLTGWTRAVEWLERHLAAGGA